MVHAEDPVFGVCREPDGEAAVLVERAGHAFNVDLAEVLEDVQKEAADGVTEFAGRRGGRAVVPAPGVVQDVREVVQFKQVGLEKLRGRRAGKCKLKLLPEFHHEPRGYEGGRAVVWRVLRRLTPGQGHPRFGVVRGIGFDWPGWAGWAKGSDGLLGPIFHVARKPQVRGRFCPGLSVCPGHAVSQDLWVRARVVRGGADHWSFGRAVVRERACDFLDLLEAVQEGLPCRFDLGDGGPGRGDE